MSNPVKPQAPMTKNGQPFYPLTTIDQVLDSGGNRLSVDSTIQVYTHKKTNNVHNFVGAGANGRAKITADFTDGDTFQVNGTAVTAYCGNDAPDGDLIATGRWVTFIVDGDTINFKSGGGLTGSKLAQATATESNVLSGKTFYAGGKTLKTGNIESKGAESVTLNASTTSKTFDTSGKYCTGNMTVSAATMEGSSQTISPGNSYTFATSGKLCTGNMVVSSIAQPITISGNLYSYARAGRNNEGLLNLHANANCSITITNLPYNYCKVTSGSVSASISGGKLTITKSVAPNPVEWVNYAAYSEPEISKSESYSVYLYN